MKDIDFDEIDRAVNSVMATKQDEVKPAEPAVASPLEAPAVTPVPDSQPEVQKEDPEPVAVSRPAQVVPARRRTGRFMDVVQPSKASRPASRTARQGTTITPRTKPAETKAEASPNWPDPLSAQPSPETVSELKSEVQTETPSTPQTEPGFESPFLTDAKVEKRPLNPGTKAETAPEVDLSKDMIRELEEHQADIDTSSSSSELDSNLVAIESGTADPKNDVVDLETGQIDQSETKATPAEAPTATSASGSVSSISQQYKEQPSSGDQSHAAIYDASQYPEPLTHPAPKKSGWLWIVWVLVLLAIGAGGAVVLYMSGLI